MFNSENIRNYIVIFNILLWNWRIIFYLTCENIKIFSFILQQYEYKFYLHKY